MSLTELELNATQRLIESEIGRSTVLFRPPYFGDAEADKPQEVEPAIVAQNLGYIMVGVRIDPDDWQLPVTADQIVQRTIDRAMDSNPETRGEVTAGEELHHLAEVHDERVWHFGDVDPPFVELHL